MFSNFINDLLDKINSVPLHWWYVAGLVLASIPLTPLIVQWVKRIHFKWTTVEMENYVIDAVLTVTSGLMTLATFLLGFGPHFADLFPYMATVWPTILALAPHVYDYSKAINNWFINRQNETQKERVQAVLKASETAVSGHSVNVQAQSFGTAAAGVDKSKLIQM